MKRALALVIIVLLFGIVGWAQNTFTGEWTGELDILPELGLESVLSITYSLANLSFTSESTFDDEGFTSQVFSVSGTLGPVSLEGSMEFLPAGEDVLKDMTYTISHVDHFAYGGGPLPPFDFIVHDEAWVVVGPAYRSSSLSLSMDFAGIALGLDVSHETYKAVEFDEICDALRYYEMYYYYNVQTDATTVEWTIDVVEKSWETEGFCCYGKYFATGEVELDIREVTVLGLDGAGNPVSATLGPLEVDYYDPTFGILVLSLTDGAEEYIENFIIEAAGDGIWAADSDGDGTPYEIGYYTDATTMNAEVGVSVDFGVLVDPADLYIQFLLPSYMTYTLTAEVEPVSVEVVFDDVCTGIQFKEATITLSGLSPCCGISVDAELAFNKCEGFNHLTLTLADLFDLCCGIGFDLEIEFTTSSKAVTLSPSFDWAGECLDLGVELGWDQPTLDSLSISYIGLTCEYGDCLKALFGTWFTSVSALVSYDPFGFSIIAEPNVPEEWGLRDLILNPVFVYQGVVVTYFAYEYETLQVEFCGPSCCGDNYTVTAKFYWGDEGILAYDPATGVGFATTFPHLFGLSRVGVSTTVPLMNNLSFTLNWEYDLFIGGGTSLSLGWSFSF